MARGRKTGGRVAGSKNKLPAEVRDMILAALDGVGGLEYLKTQAVAQPQAFMGLLGKCLPRDVNANLQGNITLQVVTGVPAGGS